MRAVVYDAFRSPPRVEIVPDPEPAPHGAVLKVLTTGLCRSDWHGWMGHDPDIVRFPHVPGHELVGEVVAVGAEVEDWEAGDVVTAPFVCACGACHQCGRGDHQICDRQTQPGFTHWGSFAELVALDHADVNLVRLPDGLAWDTAASLGCRFATAFRAVKQVGKVRKGDWVAIHGCGGLGLAAVQVAVALGARVVAVDPSPDALALAGESGAELLLPAGADVKEATGGGAYVSFDCAGGERAAAASIGSLAKRGRHVQVGLQPTPPRVPMDLVIAGELELAGAHGMAAHAYPEMLAMVMDGRLRPGRLTTRWIGLDHVPAALVAMGDEPVAGVTVIRPNG
jgi:D-arabinose 1-dehydrogenase-like Zn-dependent alcohol dehydrogenase